MQAVVIPTYNAAATILSVLDRIGPEVSLIVVVDDYCPQDSGNIVRNHCKDPRVIVVRHQENQGVGAAVFTGIEMALKCGAEIIIKVDADGQMDPRLIPALVRPILASQADYVKGNRFFFLSNAASMPPLRLTGNLLLSFLTKLSSGYWHLMDPTNGLFALQADVARLLPSDRISKRFFFESDMLFHLGLIRAKVVDFPMKSSYRDEITNLRIGEILGPFLAGHMRNLGRRLLYKYFVRDFSIASIELLAGFVLFAYGFFFGAYSWAWGSLAGESVPTGTIMLAAVTLLIGFQLLLAFLNYDILSVPREPLHPLIRPTQGRKSHQSIGDKEHDIASVGPN